MDNILPTAFRSNVVSAKNFAARLRTIGGGHASLRYRASISNTSKRNEAWMNWRNKLSEEITLAVRQDKAFFAERVIVMEGGQEHTASIEWDQKIHECVLWYVMSKEVKRIVLAMHAAEPKWTIKQVFLELCQVEPPHNSASAREAEVYRQILAAVDDFPDTESSEEYIVRVVNFQISSSLRSSESA